VRADPDFQAGWNVLANVRERLNDPAGATAARAYAASARRFRDPPDPWIDELIDDCYDADRLCVVASVAAIGGQTARARTLLERALTLAPDEAQVHAQLGQLLMKAREYTRARVHLEKALALAPDQSDNWVQLYLLLNTVGDAASAERILADGLARWPDSPALHLEKGRRLKAAGRYDEALAALEESARLRPMETEAYAERATIFIRLNRLDDAIAELRRAIAVQPADPLALLMLARAQIIQGREAAATETIAQMRRQVRVRPDDMQTVVSAFQTQFGHAPPP
jgi:Flp pilus assembly protein TadD